MDMDFIIRLAAIVLFLSAIWVFVRVLFRAALVVSLIFFLFTLFWGDGSSIVTLASSAFGEEWGAKIEDFYSDYKGRAEESSVMETENMIQAVQEYMEGKAEIQKVLDTFVLLADHTLSNETLQEAKVLLEAALELGEMTPELEAFIHANFSVEKAEEVIRALIDYLEGPEEPLDPEFPQDMVEP